VSPTLDAILRSWPLDPWLVAALLASAGVYLRGWLALHRRDPLRWHAGRLAAFVSGLAAVYLALASPIEPLANLLLQVHMVQHLLLMMVAPPLLWLGLPLFPMLRGLPRPIRTSWAIPLLSSPPLRRLFGRLTHPFAALVFFVAATSLWHIPPVYDLALRSAGWHYLEHVCFLGTALLFWYPVVRPYPARPRWSLWLLVPVLLLADLSNTVLSALLTFSDRVLYRYYTEVPRVGGISALDDQSAAGVLMWVPGSLAFLLPLFVIGIHLMSGRDDDKVTRWQGDKVTKRHQLGSRISLAVVIAPSSALLSGGCEPPEPWRPQGAHAPRTGCKSSCYPPALPSFDVLRLPLLGRFLKWRYARPCLQVPLLLLAGLVIYDGFCGPQVGAMNLAGVLPWVHWRGLVVLGLLAAGNIFCMGCPLLLPRTITRRWLPARWHWPRFLRNKWLAVLLLVLFLWAYEALALWDRPWLTAWVAGCYFIVAFVVDSLFRGASFCKYICPIGQFNFVQSLASPLEVKISDPAVCTSCQTHDCLRGRDGIPGCELHLFLPRKAGNMDCTACLDCVRACPHDNIGVNAVLPGAELWTDRPRSGVGRFVQRPDIAALVIVLVFGSFANAAGMVGPVAQGQQWLAQRMGFHSPLLSTTAFYGLAIIALPLLAVGCATMLSRCWGGLEARPLEVATRFAYTLVPLGFGMWLAHYGFHFVTGYDAVVPVTQRFAADLGFTSLGVPEWSRACCRPQPPWLLPMEILFLDVGLLLSLYAGYRMAPSLRALVPWALLMVLLFAVGIWLLFQPMQMRGTFEG
jgi:cytochrome c oxidase assembly factor CtaG/polyferredoxin